MGISVKTVDVQMGRALKASPPTPRSFGRQLVDRCKGRALLAYLKRYDQHRSRSMIRRNRNASALARYFAGECTDDERLVTESWLAEDPARRAEAEQLRALWNASRYPSCGRPTSMTRGRVSPRGFTWETRRLRSR